MLSLCQWILLAKSSFRRLSEKQTISVETLRHYAEDAKKSPEEVAKITDPKKELAFEAKGVVILDK